LPEFADRDHVSLMQDFAGLPAGTCGTVVGFDAATSTVVVSFVDADRRPLSVVRVRSELLRPAKRGAAGGPSTA